MEQSSAQNRMSGLPHAGASQGSSPQFWSHNLDAMYTEQQLQAPQGQQTPGSAVQQPLGIGWDHPVLQHPQHPQLQQQRNPIPQSSEPNVNLYSPIPQSWQSNPLQTSGRSYAPTSQFQNAQTVPNYPADQMRFESRPLHASESSAFPSFTFPNNFFPHPPQQPSMQEASYQEQPPQHSQRTEFQTSPPQPQYSLPTAYSSDLLNTIDLNNFSSAPGHHQTIDPHFLDPTGQSAQQSAMPQNYLYQNTPGLGNGAPMFDYFNNNISVQPQLGVGSNHNPMPGNGAVSEQIAHLNPQVVIQSKKPAKKPSAKKAKPQKKAKDGSTSASSDDSDLEIEAPPETSPIPPVRPEDPIAAAEYDTMQAVWSPRNKKVPAEKVKSGLMQFKDIIKALRDLWKEQTQDMKTAENNGDDKKAVKLKEGVVLQRQTMNKIVTTAMESGHPMIVEKCGEHPMALAAIYSFLADRFQASDYDGAFTVNMLKLLARFVTVDEEMLQKTNFIKLLPRLIKKGGQTTKDLGNRILDHAAASSKRKQEGPKSTRDDSPALKGSSSADSSSAEVAGSKRPRDGDSNAHPATKRSMVVTSNPKDTSKQGATANGATKRNVEAAGKPPAAAAPRLRPNVAAPKPANLFTTLSSASKRPGTTNAERAAAAAAAAKPAAEKKEKPLAPPPKPAFSFGDIMADLSKPKVTVVDKPVEERPPETEEERKKRLRKEERRKLRVTWKPDDSLTEVRLFTHDPDEELGPGDGSLRRAGDVKGEGSVLKLHKDMDELEEDDMGGPRETILGDYHALSEIAFDLPDEPKNNNFIKRGGKQIPVSLEKEAQDHREATTLMVFYSSPAEVPSTPKEPPAPETDELVPDVITFGELPDQIKSRQERYFEAMRPKPAPVPTPAYSQPQPQVNQPAGGFADFANLLKLMNPGAQQQSTPPPQISQPTPAPMTDLERTINMFRQQQPATAPQAPVSQAPVAGVDFQGILNVMKQFQGVQGGGLTQPQQQPAAMAPNFGNMFAQFGAQNQFPTGQNQYPNGQNQYSNGQNQYSNGQNHGQSNMRSVNDYEDPERKRMREREADYGSYGDYTDGQYDPRSRQKRTRSDEPRPYKYGMVLCKFWAEGKCRKGENCTFRHDSQ